MAALPLLVSINLLHRCRTDAKTAVRITTEKLEAVQYCPRIPWRETSWGWRSSKTCLFATPDVQDILHIDAKNVFNS